MKYTEDLDPIKMAKLVTIDDITHGFRQFYDRWLNSLDTYTGAAFDMLNEIGMDVVFGIEDNTKL